MRILSPEVRESLRYLFLAGMKSSSEKTVSIILNDWKHFCGIADKEAIELFIDEALCSDWGQEIAETDEFTESLIIRSILLIIFYEYCYCVCADKYVIIYLVC